MKVLVTGGAGFIGSNFIRFALTKHADWEIWNYDLLTYAGNLENLADIESNPRYHFVRGDIADATAVSSVMNNGIEVVINFAAESHVDRSITDSHVFLRTGVLGVQTLLDAARQTGVRLFYQVSTDEVYGDIQQGAYSREEDTLAPSSPYSAAKAAGDLLTLAYARTYHLPVIVSRCTNNYGPFQYPEKMLPLFITNILERTPVPVYGDGAQVRDWLHVDDHCRAIDVLIDKGERGLVYNIGANQTPEWSNLSITRFVLQALGANESMITHVADRPGHDRRYAVDTHRIEALGWSPRMTLADGLQATIQWYQAHTGWWQRIKSGAYREYYERQYGTTTL